MVNLGERQSGILSVVDAASDAVMESYRLNKPVFGADPDDVSLARAEKASYLIMAKGLEDMFPGVPIIGKTGGEIVKREMVGKERYILLHPLDGAEPFLKKVGQFAVGLAFVENGVPSFGVVKAPTLGRTYYGGTSVGGSYKSTPARSAEPIRVSDSRLEVVMQGPIGANVQTEAYIARNYPDSVKEAVGSSGLQLARIAEGGADACPNIGGSTRLEQLAAGHAILVGAGGFVARPDGSPVDYRNAGLLTGNFVARSGWDGALSSVA